jgi:hypothetical protein
MLFDESSMPDAGEKLYHAFFKSLYILFMEKAEILYWFLRFILLLLCYTLLSLYKGIAKKDGMVFTRPRL